MSISRVLAMVSRNLYTYRHSPMRILETIYWPLLDLLVWGFLTVYLQKFGAHHGTAIPLFAAYFIGALILWDLLFRAQQGVSLAYLEEVWARNLMNLFVSPLSVSEFLASTMVVSLLKLSISALIMAGLAFVFYRFDILVLGAALFPFVVLLLAFGWALGVFTTAMVLRLGQGAESLAWVLAFLFQPLSAVFYPVSVLPAWLRPVSLAIPATHVFEGMRQIVDNGGFPAAHLAWAAGLDGLYLVGALIFFHWTFARARALGLLSKVGE